MDDFANIERFITIRLIQEDTESIYSLLKSERDPIFIICAIPYYALFVESCEEYIKSNVFDEDTAKKLKFIRNNIKAYADRFGRTIRRIADVDEKQDSIFRNQLRFKFMQDWNFHYNLGTYWTSDKNIIGNTQMLSDILGIEDPYTPGLGESQVNFARQISSYVTSIRDGFAESLPSVVVSRKSYGVRIPYYCDFNTNKKTIIRKIELPKEIQLLFLHLLCSLNFVRYVLADMFMSENTWFFRITYITTYYAYYALTKLNNHICNNADDCIGIFPIDNLLEEGKHLFLSDFRNCMMHYDLQKRGVLSPGNLDKPLFGLVDNCFPGQNYESYLLQLGTYRNKVCTYLEQYFDFSEIDLKEN